ncbi:TauD/TfdA dioxygenase family protein [Actinophytocola sp. KF-1]
MTRSVTRQYVHTDLTPFGRVVETEPGADLRALTPAQLRDWTIESKVVVLRGFDLLDRDDLVSYCENWGEILTWDFGAVLDLVVRDDPANYLFARGDVPFHWDGAFARATPSFFLFQCLAAPPAGSGGETVFCDTAEVVRRATPELRRTWESVRVTYRTDKVAHYGGNVSQPLLATHPVTGETTIRYAEPLDPGRYLNPLFLTVSGIPAQDAGPFMADLAARLHDPAVCYHHEWRAGDIVIVDNHALVHGRNAFRGDPSRHLQRIQVI